MINKSKIINKAWAVRFTCSLKAHLWKPEVGSLPAGPGQRSWGWLHSGPLSTLSSGKRSESWCRWNLQLSAGPCACGTFCSVPPNGKKVTQNRWGLRPDSERTVMMTSLSWCVKSNYISSCEQLIECFPHYKYCKKYIKALIKADSGVAFKTFISVHMWSELNSRQENWKHACTNQADELQLDFF